MAAIRFSTLRMQLLLLVLVASICARVGQCVNLEKLDSLSKEDLIKLDHEVSNYYYDNYEKIDVEKKLTYDEQLYRSIRAVRHTVAANHFDFIYTSEKTMRDSAGQRVNPEKCLEQLQILYKFAQRASEARESVPLSVIDMLESSARSESGILNGNFFWLGSLPSCSHARIPHKLIDLHFGSSTSTSSSAAAAAAAASNGSDTNNDIVGRYCTAHLRAKRWPKDDPYFGNRIVLRSSLCVPESCHSVVYFDSQEVRDLVEKLTKYNMQPPFSGDQYEVSHLYCVPDEGSLYREWNLGAKLFVAFIAIWALLLLYANVKYQRRLKAMKKLNESVDIKMIVDKESVQKVESAKITRDQPGQMQNLALPGSKRNEAPSDVEDDSSPEASDVDEEFVRDFREAKRVLLGLPANKKKSRVADDRKPETVGPFDFVKAFSVKANIDFLFRRPDFLATQSQQQQQSSASTISVEKAAHQPQSPSSRRLSASNAALIKDLTKTDGGKSSTTSSSASQQQESLADQNKPKRVNIDVLDGIKVIATAYIVLSHTLMFSFAAMNDLRFSHERMMDFTMIGILNGLQVVGLFYVITGLLIGYLAFSRQKAKQLLQPSFWIIVVIGRYLRLLPAYLLVFWFAKHVAPLTSSGPYWLDYRTDDQHPRGYCSHESWWVMLTMSSADVKINFHCVPQAWYLSNDFRTLFVIPFYVMLLALNVTAGYVAIFGTMVYSAFRMTNIMNDATIDYRILMNWHPHVFNILNDRISKVYTNLAIRLSTYLLGILVGHYLYMYETGQVKKIPRWFKKYGLKVALVIGSGTYVIAPLLANPYVKQFLPSPDKLDSDLMATTLPIVKTVMELCIGAILLALCTGGGFKWFTELMSSLPARVLSNISYGVFLVHVETMYKVPTVKYDTDYFYLLLYAVWFILVSNVVAFLVHVLYEMPINNSLRFVFKKIFYSVVK